jgi:hypothetical protein
MFCTKMRMRRDQRAPPIGSGLPSYINIIATEPMAKTIGIGDFIEVILQLRPFSKQGRRSALVG